MRSKIGSARWFFFKFKHIDDIFPYTKTLNSRCECDI